MMAKEVKRMAALLCTAAMTLSLVTGCGGSGQQNTEDVSREETQTAADTAEDTASSEAPQDTASGDTAAAEDMPAETIDYTWLLSYSLDSVYAEHYEDLPVARYWMDMVWDVDGAKQKVNVSFAMPPAGSEQDNFNTLIATGEYPDVISMDYASQTAAALYDEGIVLDLTEYVEKYMPNYTAWMNEHPDVAGQMKNDGKILQLYRVNDIMGRQWGGFMYRRDWVVKYGTNPDTGDAFTGGYTDDTKTEWKDDVVFPSGGGDPLYISDWEWMFEIFEKALEEEGIEDGYAVQNYYTGYYSPDELISGFGDGSTGSYVDRDGIVRYGALQEGFRNYVRAAHHWYEEGWMDPNYEERSSDVVWFQIDSASVYSGKVGLWYGLVNQTGNGLDAGDPATEGICVYAAAQPIDDVYGDAAKRNLTPTVFYGDSIVRTGACITSKVDEDRLPALLTAIDYLYGREGALLRQYGFSKEQQDELQDPMYLKYGCDGWTTYTDEDGEDILEKSKVLTEEGLGDALTMIRVIGMDINDNVDNGDTPLAAHCYEQLGLYTPTGNITSMVTGQYTPDQPEEAAMITSNANTYLSQEVPNFIAGRADVEDDAQ